MRLFVLSILFLINLCSTLVGMRPARSLREISPYFFHSSLEEQMVNAIKNSHINKIKTLIDAGVCINYKVKDRYSYLVLARRATKALEIMQILINAGIQVNAKTGYYKQQTMLPKEYTDSLDYELGNTPLLYYVNVPNIYYMRLLINAGADVNIQNKRGITPLFLATNSPRHASTLIQAGAYFNIKTDNNETIFHHLIPSGIYTKEFINLICTHHQFNYAAYKKNSACLKEYQQKVALILWFLKKYRIILPKEIQLLILSFLPNYICNPTMLGKLLIYNTYRPVAYCPLTWFKEYIQRDSATTKKEKITTMVDQIYAFNKSMLIALLQQKNKDGVTPAKKRYLVTYHDNVPAHLDIARSSYIPLDKKIKSYLNPAKFDEHFQETMKENIRNYLLDIGGTQTVFPTKRAYFD